MTNEQIKLRLIFDAAITRHYRSLLDAARTTPALLDDLVAIAEGHATDHARRVTARQALRAEAATTLREDYGSTGAPPAVAASPDESAAAPVPGPSHRTRTRTRRTAD